MPVQDLQRMTAAVLLVLSTAPICVLLADAMKNFDGSFITEIIGAPSAAALYTTYLALIFSTLLGANSLDAVKKQVNGKDTLTRAGVVVLIYTGVIGVVGLIFLAVLSYGDKFNNLQNVTASAQGAAQVQSYASWVVGTCLGAVASLLGIRAKE
jgi:hypothetical protein